eukprot:symbB.v1.2.006431.t1/scaffold384.1/size215671/4
MKSIADHAEGRIREFEATDFSSTAWSLATLEFQHEALRAAIAEQVMIKVSCLGVQQLGSLADLKLGCGDLRFTLLWMVLKKKHSEVKGLCKRDCRISYESLWSRCPLLWIPSKGSSPSWWRRLMPILVAFGVTSCC